MALGAETNAYMFIDTVCNGPMRPQGVCRIRKAAKPPTATQWASAPTRNRKFTLSGCGQAAVIGHAVARARLVLGAEEKRAVLFDADNVCMGIFQLDERRMWAAEHLGDQA